MRKEVFIVVVLISLVFACNQTSNTSSEKRSEVHYQEVYETIEAYDGQEEIPAPPPAAAKKKEALNLEQEAYDNFNTEDYAPLIENTFKQVSQYPLSTFSIDVDRASYSNMRRFIQNGALPPKDAVRIEEMVNYFDYQYDDPKGEHPYDIQMHLTENPWNKEFQLAHIALQAKRIDSEELPPSNLVFLVDVSGSMMNRNKLPLLKSGFNLLIDNLRKEDKVSIVVYAGAAGMVLPPTSGSNKDKIRKAIDKLQAGGSTAGGAGIELAYKTAMEHFIEDGNNRVILATDGDFNVGVSSDAEMQRLIEEKRESGVFLSVLGFGMGNYKDNKMEIIANHGNGNYAYIENITEAKKVFVTEFGGTLFTVAKDVKLQVEFNPANVEAYRLIGYENRMLNKEDFNDDKKDAGEMGAGHSVTAIYEIIPKGSKSDYLQSVDELKYQEISKSYGNTTDVFTVKTRYKLPDSDRSILFDKVLTTKEFTPMSELKGQVQFSLAVAEFGLLLRQSDFRGQSNYDHVIEIVKENRGEDEEGLRSEFLQLVKNAQGLDRRQAKR